MSCNKYLSSLENSKVTQIKSMLIINVKYLMTTN